jgi:hypothetical protein
VQWLQCFGGFFTKWMYYGTKIPNMTNKVYISSQQTATFVCPECSRSKTVNVSKYAHVDKLIKVNVKCPCGHAYTSILEKRKQYRKETHLSGTYIHFIDGRSANRGLMTVKDISATGMKLKMNVELNCNIGDYLEVEFHLDNRDRTLINKRVIVRNLSGNYIGVEFGPTEAIDKALGFYLFS